VRTAPSGRQSLEEEAVSGSRGTHKPDPATARLTGWIGPVVDGAGYDLEELVVTPAGRRSVVRVVVDRDEGVTLDDIAEVSRAVSEVLDANDDGMGRPYVLEVTSPGVDRPLTEHRHWRRNVGRLVTVTAAGRSLTGRVTAADETGVVLDVDGKVTTIPYAELGPGRVQIEFKRLDEAVFPDEPEGDAGDDDEEIEDDDEDGEGEDR